MPPLWRDRKVGFKYPFELYEGLVVEGNDGNIIYTCSCLFKAVFNGLMREICIVLLPCKPLLLGCGYDLTVPDNTGGGVMIEGGYAEDISAQNCLL